MGSLTDGRKYLGKQDQTAERPNLIFFQRFPAEDDSIFFFSYFGFVSNYVCRRKWFDYIWNTMAAGRGREERKEKGKGELIGKEELEKSGGKKRCE